MHRAQQNKLQYESVTYKNTTSPATFSSSSWKNYGCLILYTRRSTNLYPHSTHFTWETFQTPPVPGSKRILLRTTYKYFITWITFPGSWGTTTKTLSMWNLVIFWILPRLSRLSKIIIYSATVLQKNTRHIWNYHLTASPSKPARAAVACGL